jgi:hypothetical protein
MLTPAFSRDNKDYYIVEELNSLLSDYFFEAATTLQPSVFYDKDYHTDESINNNAKALLIKYLLKKGSQELKDLINNNTNLQPIISYASSVEDLDSVTMKLIKAYKALQFV